MCTGYRVFGHPSLDSPPFVGPETCVLQHRRVPFKHRDGARTYTTMPMLLLHQPLMAPLPEAMLVDEGGGECCHTSLV